jgi:hypothetical protein
MSAKKSAIYKFFGRNYQAGCLAAHHLAGIKWDLGFMRNMRLLIALSIVALVGLVYTTEAGADDRCGGVLMASRGPVTTGHKARVQKRGYLEIDGGLVMNGESTCTSIHIECLRATRTCRRSAGAVASSILGPPQVLGVFMDDDYKITDWTEDTISAQNTIEGGTSYLHIAINDDVPDKAEVIRITKSSATGEWVTELMTVDNDPALEKLKHPMER